MNNKSKKSKHKTKLSDDLPEVKQDKKVSLKDSDINDNAKTENDDFEKKELNRKRKHTKVTKKSKENNSNSQIEDEQNEKGKKVKFSKIEVIDVESWKKLNLKLTADENMDELMKLSEGKKEKIKNVSCACIVL